MMKSNFTSTSSYHKINRFLSEINTSIRESPQYINIDETILLMRTYHTIKTTPLSTEPARYTNLAFRTVLESIKGDVYFENSFGNLMRTDFGTGHELNYLCHLYTLYCEGKMKISEVFGALKIYFVVARAMIRKFNVEPAGSLGKWGLDDYMVLPFALGSTERAIKGAVSQSNILEKAIDDIYDLFIDSYDRIGRDLLIKILNNTTFMGDPEGSCDMNDEYVLIDSASLLENCSDMLEERGLRDNLDILIPKITELHKKYFSLIMAMKKGSSFFDILNTREDKNMFLMKYSRFRADELAYKFLEYHRENVLNRTVVTQHFIYSKYLPNPNEDEIRK